MRGYNMNMDLAQERKMLPFIVVASHQWYSHTMRNYNILFAKQGGIHT